MTEEEFKALKSHYRVKYVGKDPKVLAQIATEPKASQAKGLVVGYVEDTARWYKPGERYFKGLVLRLWTYGDEYSHINPEDWVLVDGKRTDLVISREKRKVKYADRDVRKTLDAFTETFSKMKEAKKQVDAILAEIPLASKLKILTSLTEEQKMWLDLLSEPAEEILKLVKEAHAKRIEDDPVQEVQTQPEGAARACNSEQT